MQHVLHMVFVDFFLFEMREGLTGREETQFSIKSCVHYTATKRTSEVPDGLKGGKKAGAYFQKDFSQGTNHVESAILFPGVYGLVSEDMVAEDHCLLQHLNTLRNAQGHGPYKE